MSIKKHDFLEVEYSGVLKGDNLLFDTTSEADAKKHNVHRTGARYGPLTVCVGEHFLLPGLDEFLIGKEVGKEYKVDLTPEQGFGKKDPKLIQMIPTSKFQESKINPFPGLQINVDGQMGMVKTVGAGRVMIDFNHPLSGKDLGYTITVKNMVTDEKQKVDAYLKHLGLDNLDIKSENGVVSVALHMEMPKEIADQFSKRIREIIPTLKEVKFTVNESAKGKMHDHGHDQGHHGHDHSHHGHDHSHHGHKH
jgi:FKBP-type peptidyl-prolyl cis-trans isomerase 2